VIRSNCLRACSVESSTISGNDFMAMRPQANSKAASLLARVISTSLEL
jgi:hypothetical protein